MALVCVKELDTRSRVQFSTSCDQFHSYGTHVQVTVSRSIVSYERRSRPRDLPRSSQRPRRYRCRTCACASRHARKDTAAKRPERFGLSRTRAARRQQDHALRARLAAAAQVAKSPLSLVDAKPSNARDRGSDHTDICRHADELATLLPATKLLQPPSAAEAAKPCGRARVSGCQLQWRSQGGF